MDIRTIIVDATAPRKRFENSEGDAAPRLLIAPVTFAYRGAERIALYHKNCWGHCASVNDKQGDAIETSGLRFVTYLSCDSKRRRGTAGSPRKVPANGLAALAQIYLSKRSKTCPFYVACPRCLKGNIRSTNFFNYGNLGYNSCYPAQDHVEETGLHRQTAAIGHYGSHIERDLRLVVGAINVVDLLADLRAAPQISSQTARK